MTMEKQVFTNEIILSWLQYYAGNTTIDLEHVKIIDITRKNKNVIPTVESHKTTLIFTNAGINDIFTVFGMPDWGNVMSGITRVQNRAVRFTTKSEGHDRSWNQCIGRNADRQS